MANQFALAYMKDKETLQLKAYNKDGHWTVGYGATGANIVEGTVWTQAQADLDLENRIDQEDRAVAMMTSPVVLPLRSQAALISFADNCGPGRLMASPIVPFVRARNWIAAAKALLLYDHVEGTEWRGLLQRRLEEAAMLLAGVA